MSPINLPISHLSEGLTIDTFYRLLTQFLLDPRLIFLLTFLRTRALDQSPSNVLRLVWQRQADTLTSYLVGCLGLSWLLWVNGTLSHASRNNWVLGRGSKAGKWGWDQGGENAEVVLITGGSGSVGMEMVQGFGDLTKAKVVVLDVVEPKGGPFPNMTFYHCDLGSPEEIKKVCETVVDEVGQPSVLINNAGVVRSVSILNSTTRDVDLTYDINVKSHYYTVQAFLPGMIKAGKGHIVVRTPAPYIESSFLGLMLRIDSCLDNCVEHGLHPSRQRHAASKSSTLSFHEGLTEELRHLYGPSARSIRTSAILPGHIRGPMFEGFDAGMPRWLMPSLQPRTVARLVVRCVMSGESQFVIEPLYAKTLPLVRALPTWLGDVLYGLAKNSLAQVQLDQDGKKVQ
ncbi:BZ3500_MvSof-1268-A1-R1_Chr8-2g10267 [Microbotryum saponariae]|uniref:BZ3500_MvSof-1268-A1-R1_Chr8-2g10267 protein n=1 Tax=Microbotryum saponariae TaxID=289078 RepID=A0A2X0LZF8_9BASI|nr:BZ3500_MvSof-1268-A1-R1_Chr8-2g10267 [Microbotryum saponariae]SDA02065.1 BZ3501_MvSof-1269-A2-R1_Chr8-2g10017 [Microbotryum saponariae]